MMYLESEEVFVLPKQFFLLDHNADNLNPYNDLVIE